MIRRMIFISTITSILVVSFTVLGAYAKFPDKPIKLIVQYSAGGSTDLCLRILSSIASEYLGQPIVAVNKSGGGGAVAHGVLAKAKPDGYTIGGLSNGGAVIGALMRKVAFDPKKDFDFICQFASYGGGMAVRADAPWKTFKELIDYARKNPNQVTFATTGVNSNYYFTSIMLFKENNVKLIHVPYKGGAPAVAALLGGHVDVAYVAETCEQARAGNLRLLLTPRKYKDFPDVPSYDELGYNIPPILWTGIAGPNGIPPERIEILENAYKKATESEAFNKLLNRFDMGDQYRGSEEFEAVVFDCYDKLFSVMKNLGILRNDLY